MFFFSFSASGLSHFNLLLILETWVRKVYPNYCGCRSSSFIQTPFFALSREPSSTIGSSVSGARTNLYFLNRWITAILISVMASRVAMHCRGPTPKGMKASGFLLAFSSELNLKQNNYKSIQYAYKNTYYYVFRDHSDRWMNGAI